MKTNQIHSLKAREIVGILMESAFYLELTLKERHCLLLHLLNTDVPETR